jgi:hypothetical protein
MAKLELNNQVLLKNKSSQIGKNAIIEKLELKIK